MNLDQIIMTAKIREFLTQRNPVSLFLGLLAVSCALLLAFGSHQLAYEPPAPAVRPLSPLAQSAIVLSSGLLMVGASRALLLLLASRREVAVGWWLLAELIVVVAALTTIVWLVGGLGRLPLASVAGSVTLGVLAVEVVPYVVAFLSFRLQEEHAEVLRLQALLDSAPAAEPQPAAGNIDFYEKGGRMAFATQADNVLYIEAADNYTNIHYLNGDREDTFILHNSMKEIESRYADRGLIRCQRGYMVNIANVKLMRKEAGGFTLELNHTSRTIPVSKSYAEEVTRRFQAIR